MKEQLKAFISQVQPMDKDELQLIVSAFSPCIYKRSETILATGIVCNEFYFVVSGGIRVFFLTSQGQETTNYIALENTFTGQMARSPAGGLLISFYSKNGLHHA